MKIRFFIISLLGRKNLLFNGIQRPELPPGLPGVDAEGRTNLESDPSGKHRYLLADEIQKAQTLEALVQLASQPPGR